ncbi:glycerophosphodiester phosphodiesterase family protein [Sulfitobacter guttiformis]|uniref:Glycerophosphoryl diester phosphodiesterase n=1 Tax=Sulfitobacter guttiformis TaxID=74349 RepID=A0A420DR43_9RHOB|nr:glycerophosphodiester phosphodiesterase family protein [Sulfitobacter guttiformis]KIN74132.1 Glycerophosphoryl diester phosphodiesterase [Sulfitobacter guttiformis KCTC 32187]RKE96746.1 glycerophosphoryl diester phosphodiesterase [Sulfitobacter guttiformis]
MTTPVLPRSFALTPFAHRALHDVAKGRPENSRAAIRAAIAGGYGIEIDVQLSADGAAMVFHDYHLERLTEMQGAVQLFSADTLKSTALRGGNEGIPDLQEVLEIVAGQVPLLIELKDQDGAMGPKVGLLERATATALHGYKGDVAVMSFNPHAVAMMQALSPDVPRGLTTSAYRPDQWPLSAATCAVLRGIPDYTRVGASFISHEVDDLHSDRVSELKNAGAVINCWTVRSAAQEAKARRVVDTITFEGYAAVSGA